MKTGASLLFALLARIVSAVPPPAASSELQERKVDPETVGTWSFNGGGKMCANFCNHFPYNWRCVHPDQWPKECFAQGPDDVVFTPPYVGPVRSNGV
ncbi:hypothetical protein BAUCODRAFT_38423 [Baudoinia panamericana UAMH 10762]|uniref:Uncharacterized protein n=1 Tax=Baudoinia panamericana (strain UAMH 10762) TaxID=717646 RepID=M2MLU9_BAUPA|nr:uncharacterized protein BAUCODRAFT_38423 [Baudoinia panamericana UAMH 10762]EMC92368.1 hypothetical protein BAUCODRAFT_38423 [Baudoinia panamericana UAMH 10762]